MSTSGSFSQRIEDIKRRKEELDRHIGAIRDNLLYHPQEAYVALQTLLKQTDDLYHDHEEWANELGAVVGQPAMQADVQREGREIKIFLLGAQGHALLAMGKLNQAANIFQQALALLGDQPSDSRDTFLFYLGAINYQLGLFIQAESYYKQAYEQGMMKAAACQQALQNLTDATSQQRPYIESMLEKARQGSVEALASLALCTFMRNDRSAYIRYMDAAKKLAQEHGLLEQRRKLELNEWQFRIYTDTTGEVLNELSGFKNPMVLRKLDEDIVSQINIKLFAAEYAIASGRDAHLQLASTLLNSVEQLAKAHNRPDALWSVRMARIELATARGEMQQALEQAKATLDEARDSHLAHQIQQALNALIKLQVRSEMPEERKEVDGHMKELEELGASDALVEVLLDRSLALIHENNAEAALRDIEKAEVYGAQEDVRLQIQFAKVATLKKLGRKQEALQLGLETIERYNEHVLPVGGPMLTEWQDVLKRLDSLYTAMTALLVEVRGLDHAREAFELAEKGKAQLLRHQLIWSREQASEVSRSVPDITYETLHRLLIEEEAALVMFGIQEADSWVFILDPSKAQPEYQKIGLTSSMLKMLLPDMQTSPGTRDKLFSNLEPLAERLLPPLREVVEHCKILYIVPDSQLYGVPFAALALNDGFRLIEHCALAFVPSATVLNWCRAHYQTRSEHTCLALGVGDAETRRKDGSIQKIHFAPQANAVAQLHWDQCELLPETASADDVLSRAPAYSVLHLACHGSVDSKSSDVLSSSSLTLANETKLTAKQIYDLNGRLSAELVFLNACVSANFHQTLRNEVGGFWQAFLQAGASALIATLTLVDPLTAQPLAIDFYQRWLAGNISKAEALRQAQLHMLHSQTEVPMLDRPIKAYDWASHILIGYHR